ncbi:MAG: hypothetical protein H6703_07175, partial [Myxococcales bacterium]|nr:hypothetical protein [Myxococcales bacterium]
AAEHTLALAGIERVDAVAVELDALLGMIPLATVDPEMSPDTVRAEVTATLGFDPRSASGWTEAGVDPTAGLALAVDGRLFAPSGAPWPVALLRVTDRGKLVAALGKAGLGLTLTLPETDGVARATWKGGQALVGDKAGWTAILLAPDALDAARPAFAAWLSAPGGLADGPAGAALRLPAGPRVFIAGFTAPIVTQIPDLGEDAPLAAHFAARFPAAAASLGADLRTGRVRVLADEAAVAALRQIFVPEEPSPDFDRFVDPSMALTRLSLDLGRLFDGALALLPGNRGDLRGKVVIAQNALPVALGVSQADLAAAFTGHLAFATPATALQQAEPPLLVFAAIGDAATADRVLPVLIDKLVAQQAGAKRAPTKFGEHPGHVVTVGTQPMFFVRAGDVLVAGPDRAAIEAAIARTAKGAPVAAGTFLAMSIPLAAMGSIAPRLSPEQKPLFEAGSRLWAERAGDPMHMALRIDEAGIVSDGPATAATFGVAAAGIAASFDRYLRRSKESLARVALRQIYQGAMMRAIDGPLPPAAPLTPPDDPCQNGGTGSYTATATTWNHPTWVGLGFAPVGTQYYRYAYEPTDDGFVARAIGDLDCDGVASTYEFRARKGEDGGFIGTPSDVDPLE